MIRIERVYPGIVSRIGSVLIAIAILLSSPVSGSFAGRSRAKWARKATATIAGHRIIRIFDLTNSPIRPVGFDPGKLFQDRSGRYWVSGTMGSKNILSYDDTDQRWTTFSEERGEIPGSHFKSDALLPFEIKRMAQSKEGRLWLGDEHANALNKPLLTSFDGTRWERFEFPESAEASVKLGFARDADGTLWFWSGEELRSYDGKRWSPVTKVSEIFEESAPTKEPGGDWKKFQYQIFDAIQDRDKFWWFAMVSGIVRYDKRKNEWRRFPQIEPNFQIYEDKMGRIWFGDRQLVSVYDKGKDSVRNFRLSDYLPSDRCGYSPPALRCMYQDKRGQMLFGHACGLLCYSETSSSWNLVTFANLGISGYDEESNEVNDIMEDKNGRIWVSISNAIVVLEP